MTSTIANWIDNNTQENLFVESPFPRFCLQGMKLGTCFPKHYNFHLPLKQGRWEHKRHRCVSFWLGATLWRWAQPMVCNQQMVGLAAVISEWHWRLWLTFCLALSLTHWLTVTLLLRRLEQGGSSSLFSVLKRKTEGTDKKLYLEIVFIEHQPCGKLQAQSPYSSESTWALRHV